MLFPSTLVINQQNLNIDLMKEYSKEWSIERQQVQKGLYCGSIIAVHTPFIQISFSEGSHGQLILGDFPKNTILLFLIVTDGIASFQGKPIQCNELVVIQSGDEIDILINSKSYAFTIAIEETLFRDSFESYFLKSVDTILEGKRLLVNSSKKEIFETKLKKWIEYFGSNTFTLKKEKEYIQIENRILEDIFRTLLVDVKKVNRVKFDIKNVRDKLHESLIDTEISISTISHELSISQRQLHHSFKNSYGISPKQYLQVLRLNKVRRELLYATSKSITVSEIAFKYGFTHLSHFSKLYKDMFHELPSKTLN